MKQTFIKTVLAVVAISLAAMAATVSTRPQPLPSAAQASLTNAIRTIGCVMAHGYWKNHTQFDGKQADPAWMGSEYNRIGETSWYEVLRTPTRGSAWLILAQQYVAAALNQRGAYMPPAVQTAYQTADNLLAVYPAPGSVPDDQATRAQFLSTASQLESYNSGTAGVPTCGK